MPAPRMRKLQSRDGIGFVRGESPLRRPEESTQATSDLMLSLSRIGLDTAWTVRGAC
jgi:hypothetical protein